MSQPTQKQLCYTCHDGTGSTYNAQAEFGESTAGTSTMTSFHPVPTDVLKCTDCHTPHIGPLEGNPMSLAAGPSRETTGNAVCGSCHGATTTLPEGDIATRFTGTAHDTTMSIAQAGGSTVKCLACHEAHGSTNVALIDTQVLSIGGTRTAVSMPATSAATTLCFACHDVQDGNYRGQAAYTVTKHSTVVTSVVAATVFPGSGAVPGSCENCHDPHGTGQPHMLRASGDSLCYTCHDAAGTTKPPAYSYQGQVPYGTSGHASISGAEVPGFTSLSATSTGFMAYEGTSSPTPSSPGTPMSADKIARLASMDASYAVTSLASVTGQHDYQVYRFKSPVAPSGANWVRLNWAGYGEELAGYPTAVSVWSKSANGGAGAWVSLANGLMADITQVTSTSPDPSDVIDANGYIWLMGDATKVIQSAIIAGPIVASANALQATITWTTAGYASSWVDYGPTSAYGGTVGTEVRTSTHSVTIPLSGDGVYHFRVRTAARDGDSTTTADSTFTTFQPVLDPALSQAAQAQSFVETFTWTMSDLTRGPYTYDIHVWSTNPAMSTCNQTYAGLTSLASTQTVWIEPFAAATLDWQVRARDAAGNYSPWTPPGTFTLTDTTVYYGFLPGGTGGVPAPATISDVSFVPDQRLAKLHRSLNVDMVSIGISTKTGGTGSGCTACHAVHGGGTPNVDGTMPNGALIAPQSSTCLGYANGGCHDDASQSAGRVDINARLTAAKDNSAHHDLLPAAQAATGAKIVCTDCHDPHTNSATARYSNPDTISVSIATSMGPYTDANGRSYLLVGAMHDGTAPVFTAGPSITGTSSASTVLTPTVSWVTDEPATGTVDFGTSPGVYTSSYTTSTLSLTHVVPIAGLLPNTLYYWRVRTSDALGNTRSSAEATYSTTLPPAYFTAGPTLTGNGWYNFLTPSVTWGTNDQFTTKLEWGTSSGVYTNSSTSGALSTSHSASMSGLTTDTVYYWRASGVDATGRILASAEATYAASPPPLPLILSGPWAMGNSWSTYATPTVTWTTTDVTSSWLEWGTSSGVYTSMVSTDALTTSHSLVMTGLTPDTTYYFKVFGFDPAGRIVASGESTYTATAPSSAVWITAGPTLNGSSYSTAGTPTVTWTSSDLMSSWVDWGTTSGAPYASSVGTTTTSVSHGVAMSGLTYGQTYYWRVRGLDATGNLITSAEQVYTPAAYPTPVTVGVSPSAAYYDSSLQPGASMLVTCTPASIQSGHALQYQLYLNGAPFGTWQSSTTWSPTCGAGTYTTTVVARDASLQSLTTTSANSPVFSVYDTYSGSCPFVFTWNGSDYAFGADQYAAGKLGTKSATGYLKPTPQDLYVLNTVPAEKDGALELRLVEERNETDYLDSLHLYAIDTTAGTGVVPELPDLNRTYKGLPGALHSVGDSKPADSVVNVTTGQDLTSLVASDDGRVARLNDDNNDFSYQTLEIDPGDISSASQVKLVLDAFSVFPSTPQGTALAATFGPRTKLQVQDAAGAWVSVPATAPVLPKPFEFMRPYSLDISHIWQGPSRKLRVTFLFKTYIDSIRFDTSTDVPLNLTEVPLTSAVLQHHGMDPRNSPNDGYQFVYGASNAKTGLMPGNYTAFGDVSPLLSAIDDKFVIYGGGDEMVLRFSPPAAPAAGMVRTYVLSTDGYYKDYKTDVTHTVEPLPFAAMSNFPYPSTESYPTDADHQAYLAQWNTRSITAGIPTATVSALKVTSGTGVLASTTSLVTQAARAQGATAPAVSAATAVSRVHPSDALAAPVTWMQVHGPKTLVVGVSAAPRVSTARVHYSVNTDMARLTVEYWNDSLATAGPDAGWYSTGATPTPSAPGTAALPVDLANVSTQDGNYWITSVTATEGAYNWQLMRFDSPSTPNVFTARNVRIDWIGHGEPTSAHPTVLYAWNFNTSKWDLVSSGQYTGTPTDTNVSTFADKTDGGATCISCHDGTLPQGVVMPSGITTIAPVWQNDSNGDWHGPRVGPSGFSSSSTLAFPYSAGQSSAVACEVCHDPHGSSSEYHFPSRVNGGAVPQITNGPQAIALCQACHKGDAVSYHQQCYDCHYAPAHWGDLTYLLPNNSSDCLQCHRHGATWPHPYVGCGDDAYMGCHNYNPGTWRTF